MECADMYKAIYNQLFHVSKCAGIIAKKLQHNIQNEGKDVEFINGENAQHKAMREAKTSVDVMIQEMFLQTLYPDYHDMLSLDVEEVTDMILNYTNMTYETTLVLDPIDGTLDYIHQLDTYSICSAIIQEHDVKVAIVYFPERNVLYAYCEGEGALVYNQVDVQGVCDGQSLNIQPHTDIPNKIYKNSRLSNAMVSGLVQQGFDVVDDTQNHLGCPDAIKACMYGDGLAYFSDTRNIRDILLGAILSKMPKGHAYTFQGERASWKSRGRQSEIVFSIYEKEVIFK